MILATSLSSWSSSWIWTGTPRTWRTTRSSANMVARTLTAFREASLRASAWYTSATRRPCRNCSRSPDNLRTWSRPTCREQVLSLEDPWILCLFSTKLTQIVNELGRIRQDFFTPLAALFFSFSLFASFNFSDTETRIPYSCFTVNTVKDGLRNMSVSSINMTYHGQVQWSYAWCKG